MVERWVRIRNKNLLVPLCRNSIYYNPFQSLTLGFLRTSLAEVFKDNTGVGLSWSCSAVFGAGEAEEEPEGSCQWGKGTIICFFCWKRRCILTSALALSISTRLYSFPITLQQMDTSVLLTANFLFDFVFLCEYFVSSACFFSRSCS